MCLNSGEMTTDNFFSKKFRRGKNDREYYGILFYGNKENIKELQFKIISKVKQ